ncbi:MAG: GNAT family N-acetyltransferase [Christensenellaceae bacterium]|nr:GNAT family N-acetyltransferase [Christensenellaceae bacterium]
MNIRESKFVVIAMKIIKYQEKYRDDMIFMVLEAKNALGRVPHLNEDLLDVEKYYFLRGDMFWLAINDNDRVIGCIGYNGQTQDSAKLHRLYVKYDMKRQGIGTELLKTAELHMKNAGYRYSIVHLGGTEYFESKQFYPKHGYTAYKPGYMRREL